MVDSSSSVGGKPPPSSSSMLVDWMIVLLTVTASPVAHATTVRSSYQCIIQLVGTGKSSVCGADDQSHTNPTLDPTRSKLIQRIVSMNTEGMRSGGWAGPSKVYGVDEMAGSQSRISSRGEEAKW